jgi:hypothetical protein
MSTSILNTMYKKSDYKDKSGMIFNMDCMNFMSQIKQGGGI